MMVSYILTIVLACVHINELQMDLDLVAQNNSTGLLLSILLQKGVKTFRTPCSKSKLVKDLHLEKTWCAH